MQGTDAGSPPADAASADLATLSGPESDPLLKGITALHNQVRASVSPQPAVPIPPLVWDPTLAAAAQAVVDNCMTSYSSGGNGTNSVASISAQSSASTVVNAWKSEAARYDYATNTCSSGTCAHYTQVVWRDSQKLGCAQKTCTTNSPFQNYPTWYFWVCFYSPAGNVNGQKPY
jgi:uncharacterized protein YkwD